MRSLVNLLEVVPIKQSAVFQYVIVAVFLTHHYRVCMKEHQFLDFIIQETAAQACVNESKR